jgi:hypothetical protein
MEVVKLLRQAAKIADAIIDAVVKGAHVQLINDCIFVPEWIVFQLNIVFAPTAHAALLS